MRARIVWNGPAAEIDHSGNPYVDQFIHGRAEGPISHAGQVAVIGEGRGPLRLPVLRRQPSALGGPLRRLRRLEHHRRGAARRRARPRASRPARGRKASISSPSRRERAGRRAADSGIAEFDRVVRRRPGAGLGAPDRRRSRHRQIDPAAPGRRRPRPLGRRPPARSTSPARKRSSRSGCAPSGWASARRRSSSRPRPPCATSSRRLDAGRAAGARRHRFDPDHVCRHARSGAGHGHPGARLGRRS